MAWKLLHVKHKNNFSGVTLQDIILEDKESIQQCKEYKYSGIKITQHRTLNKTNKGQNI